MADPVAEEEVEADPVVLILVKAFEDQVESEGVEDHWRTFVDPLPEIW